MTTLALIAERPLVWGLFLAYLIATSVLAYLGHNKTKDMRSFAVGKGDMHPVIVGMTLAASLASTATFVINPGFVYVYGISALMHYGLAAGLGVITGLLAMSVGFRRIGAKTKAITLPGWMGERYQSKSLAMMFAGVNLLSLSFVVLIVGGLSIVMQQTLGLSNVESLLLILGFVFSYIFVGGTYAHAYTNTMQGLIMVVVSVIIVVSGLHLLGGDVLGTLTSKDPHLAAAVNTHSPLFGSFFSVYVCGFMVGFALVCQPHILTKALYVKTDRAVRQYLAVTIAVSLVFSTLLLVGLYAHLMDLPREAFVDPATGGFSQDRVMAVYLAQSFGPVMLAFITVALLAAGMSTLDGILVALSSIAAGDLFLNLTRHNLLRHQSESQRLRIAHRASQLILVAMGVAAFVIAVEPPKLLGIFGQVGVYGMVVASTVPILVGIVVPRATARLAWATALVALVVHFGLYGWGQWAVANQVDLVAVISGFGPLSWLFDTSAIQLGLRNPAVTATYALLASGNTALGALAWSRLAAARSGVKLGVPGAA